VCNFQQTQVEEPEVVQRVKQRLQDKDGVPVDYQRLVFAVPSAEEVVGEHEAFVDLCAQEVGRLQSWQASSCESFVISTV
jgi:hypothetical protein